MPHLLNRVARIIQKPGFWLILVLLVLVTLPHYLEALQHPEFVTQILSSFKLDRAAFERILYLVPIVWSGFLFGWRGTFATSLVSLVLMLPKAVLSSANRPDAVFETFAVFVIGNAMTISFESLRKAREQRTQIEVAHHELQSHTRIIEENEKRLATLNQISNTVSQSLELGQILTSAINRVVDVIKVDSAWMYLIDPKDSGLVMVAHRGVSQKFAEASARLHMGEGLSGTVAQSGQPLYIEDLSKHPQKAAVGAEAMYTVLIVPLSSKGKVNGVIGVTTRTHRPFQKEEIDLLTAIGNQIGVAVENARLYQREQEVVAELRSSEARYRELFESAHDAIWIHDLNGDILAANRAAAKMTGYSIDELVTMNVMAFLSPESGNLAREIKEKLLGNQPMAQPYQQSIIRKDGTQAFIQLTTSIVLRDNKPVAFQHIARDVSEERRLQENLRFYLHQATLAQEEERKRISRELHDDTIQALVVLSRNLDAMSSKNDGLSEDSRQRLEELRQQTNAIMTGVRRLSQDLRPAALDRLGLLPALEWLANDTARYSGINIKLKVTGAERRLAEEVQLVLFRITQEALRNIWRHSRATQADITVEFTERLTRISIEDNGVGFDVPRSMGDLARVGKLGLAGIQERASLIGAELTAESELNQGTKIIIELPA